MPLFYFHHFYSSCLQLCLQHSTLSQHNTTRSLFYSSQPHSLCSVTNCYQLYLIFYNICIFFNCTEFLSGPLISYLIQFQTNVIVQGTHGFFMISSNADTVRHSNKKFCTYHVFGLLKPSLLWRNTDQWPTHQ